VLAHEHPRKAEIGPERQITTLTKKVDELKAVAGTVTS
jgi:hypothetical protein